MKPQPAITVEDLRDDVETVRHAHTCKGAELQTYVGTRGDDMLSCRSCRAFRPVEVWMLIDAATVMKETPVPPEPTTHHRPSPATGWVCRTHQNQTVRPDGRGCRECHHAAQMRRRAKKITDTEPDWNQL